MLSFHIGNVDLMRDLAHEEKFTVNRVGCWENEEEVNRLLEEIDPAPHLNVISVDSTDPLAGVRRVASASPAIAEAHHGKHGRERGGPLAYPPDPEENCGAAMRP